MCTQGERRLRERNADMSTRDWVLKIFAMLDVRWCKTGRNTLCNVSKFCGCFRGFVCIWKAPISFWKVASLMRITTQEVNWLRLALQKKAVIISVLCYFMRTVLGFVLLVSVFTAVWKKSHFTLHFITFIISLSFLFIFCRASFVNVKNIRLVADLSKTLVWFLSKYFNIIVFKARFR